MAKVTLTDIESGYQLKEAYNANNDLLEAAIENTLSRDGTTPNQMEAELDMNSNKVINVADGTSSKDAANYGQLIGKAFSELDVGDAPVVATVAAMQAILAPSNGDVVFVTEEGLGGFFVYDATETEPQDGSMVFEPNDATPGAWVRRDSTFMSMKVPSVLFPNAIWTWWQPNLTAHYDDVTYLCYSDDSGRSYIASYDHETAVINQSFLKNYSPDDHHAGAIVVTENYPVVVFTHGRSLTLLNRIYYRRSVNPKQITSLQEEESFNFTNPSQQTDYPTAFVSGSEILVMCRLGLDKWCARYATWPLATTPDWGSSDADDNKWFYDATIARPYVLPRQDINNPDIIHLVLATLPESTVDEEDVRYGYLRISTGAVYTAAGVEIGNIKTRVNMPLTMSDFTSVYAAASGTKTRVYDISSDGQAILFSTYTGSGLGATASTYQYARRQVDNTWTTHEVIATGTPLLFNYYGGGAFDYDNSRLFYLCRESSGTWYLESVVSNDEASFTHSLVEKSTDILMRPITVINAGSEIRYLWQKIKYYNAFEEFYSDGRSAVSKPIKTRAFNAGSLISLGDNALDVPTNTILGSPQDLKVVGQYLYGDTAVTEIDIPLPAGGHRFFELILQGPRIRTTSSTVELRMQFLDANLVPITTNYWYAGKVLETQTPAETLVTAEAGTSFLLARGAWDSADRRMMGRIFISGGPHSTTIDPQIRASFTSPYISGTSRLSCTDIHGARYGAGQTIGGIRLFASTGNISSVYAHVVGMSATSGSLLI